jgi:inorganic pyrophosphatase
LDAILKLGARNSQSGEVHIVIDTPRGSRNKYKFDEKLRLFKLGGVLPAGAVFPFDFGFIPQTLGEDGDALDTLLLMDEPTFVGCLVLARLIGVVEAEQTEEGKTMRNDRLIAVAATSRNHHEVKSLTQLNTNLLDEIEHFFVSYNQIKGKKFKSLGRFGPKRAEELLSAGMKSYQRKHKPKGKGGK